ncbi:MAG TPA: hypothetical protein GXX51_02200 [Firmicutes bacterium]|nr:hypothetical protein [Bacillota bacterium]
MGWFCVLLSGIAPFLMFKMGHTLMMIFAIIAAVGCFWSWGVMHNYATELAKRRWNYTGGFYDITPEEAQAVPDWITWINMGFTFMGVILLIIGIIMVMRG